jgi:Tol biopolymer transport system component
VSANGLLIYGAPRSTARELTWVTRAGVRAGAVGGPSDAWDVRIAPGGRAVAVTELDRQLSTLDVWIYDGVSPIPRRLSPSLDADEGAVWAPDGSRLAWVSGRRQVLTRGALGMLPEDSLARFDGPVRVWSYSRDGAMLIVSLTGPDTGLDLWLLPARGAGEPAPYAITPFNEAQGAVSPDGRWLAYASDESGEYELYLDSLPRPGDRIRLTLGGGSDPRWRGDGREVYFRRGNAVYALGLDGAGTTPTLGATTRLFDAGPDLRAYDATADGQRFLVNVPAAADLEADITAVVNWPSLAPRETPGRPRP